MNLDEIEARWPEGRLANSDARADVVALIARVRELEAESAKWKTAFENIRRENTDLMMQLFDAKERVRVVNIEPVLHENARLRSHARAASNLLAIIHGDGGHYEGKHGTVKACKDAEGVVSELRLKLDAATYARQTGYQCQWEAGDSPCNVHGDSDK